MAPLNFVCVSVSLLRLIFQLLTTKGQNLIKNLVEADAGILCVVAWSPIITSHTLTQGLLFFEKYIVQCKVFIQTRDLLF